MWGYDCWSVWGHGMGIGGMVMMLVFWALSVAGIVILIGWLRKRDFVSRGETPLDMLKKRYALGEIGKDEFERMKKDLDS